MIKYSRGKIQIIDLDALTETACECYATIKGHYRELLASKRRNELFPPPLWGRGIACPRRQAIALEGKFDSDSVS